MKSWIYAMMVVSAAAYAGCSSGGTSGTNTGGDGGSSDGGGGNGGGVTSVTSATSTGSNMVTSTSTGVMPAACDNTGVCQDQDMDTTNDCVSCAFESECVDQVSACGGEPDCCDANPCSPASYVGCINACVDTANACEMACGAGDQACVDQCGMDFDTCGMACQTQNPQGAMLYNDLVLCVICDTCPVDCDGPGSGCM
jgi:hypothetical protein